MLRHVEAELRAATTPRPRLSPTSTRSVTPLDIAAGEERIARFHRRSREFTKSCVIVAVAFAAFYGVWWLVDAIDGVVGEAL